MFLCLIYLSHLLTGSPQNLSPTEWSKTPAPAHREKAPSSNTQEKRIVSDTNIHFTVQLDGNITTTKHYLVFPQMFDYFLATRHCKEQLVT